MEVSWTIINLRNFCSSPPQKKINGHLEDAPHGLVFGYGAPALLPWTKNVSRGVGVRMVPEYPPSNRLLGCAEGRLVTPIRALRKCLTGRLEMWWAVDHALRPSVGVQGWQADRDQRVDGD